MITSNRISALQFRRGRKTVALLAATAAAAVAGEAPNLELRLVDGEAVVAVEVPAHCSARYGPGTAEAVCVPDGSVDASRTASVVASLYFEVTLQVTREANSPVTAGLAQNYAFADFQKELPGSVCGEERVSRIRIDSPQRQVDNNRVIYSAQVTCPEVRFLGLGARRATVRYLFADGIRVTAMARSLSEDYERSKPLIDAFHASVVLQPEKKP